MSTTKYYSSQLKRLLTDEEVEAIRHKQTGLGDLVAKVAQPIAGAIDAVIGTNIKGCGGCAQRHAALNRIVPDIAHPFAPSSNELVKPANNH